MEVCKCCLLVPAKHCWQGRLSLLLMHQEHGNAVPVCPSRSQVTLCLRMTPLTCASREVPHASQAAITNTHRNACYMNTS